MLIYSSVIIYAPIKSSLTLSLILNRELSEVCYRCNNSQEFIELDISRAIGNLAFEILGIIPGPEISNCNIKLVRGKYAIIGTPLLWKYLTEEKIRKVISFEEPLYTCQFLGWVYAILKVSSIISDLFAGAASVSVNIDITTIPPATGQIRDIQLANLKLLKERRKI